MNSYQNFDTPILLLTWRRSYEALQVLDSLAKLRPVNIYIASDGARPHVADETAQIEDVRRAIVARIDWPCNLNTLFSPVNRGCRWGVIHAINWFFSNVDEGIILEDDCVPHPDFFPYCHSLLARYRHDSRISIISGYNQNGSTDLETDYFFSRLGGIWGWATWRRAWLQNDENLSTLSLAMQTQALENVLPHRLARHRYEMCIQVRDGNLDSWAYGWGYSRLISGGLACVPSRSLISNIGFGQNATHTTHGSNIYAAKERVSFPLKHPHFMLPLNSYDNQYLQSRTKKILSIPRKVIFHLSPLALFLKSKILHILLRASTLYTFKN